MVVYKLVVDTNLFLLEEAALPLFVERKYKDSP